jgi:hypothetical protein
MQNSESMSDAGCFHAAQPGESGVHVLEAPEVSLFLAAGNKTFFKSTSHDGTSRSISHQTDPTETLSTSTGSPTAGMDICLKLPRNKCPYQGTLFAYNLYQEFWTHQIGLSIAKHPRLFPTTSSPHQLMILFNTSDTYQLKHHQNAVTKDLKQMKEFIETKLHSMMVDEAQRQDMRHLNGQLVTKFEHIREQFERNLADLTNASKIWFVYYGAPDIHKCWLDILENYALFSFNYWYSETYEHYMVSP